MAFYSSEWAARSCLENFQVERSKVKVIPYGSNLGKDWPLEDVDRMISARPAQPCKLVFSGTAWERKGGDLALRLAEELNRSGLPTELTLIGCIPPVKDPFPRYVNAVGYLDISRPEDRQAYITYLSQSHFLVLPTRADCSPRVICEANSLGVPCITTDIGGIPSMIKPDVNGNMFPPTGEFVPAAARYILDVMRRKSAYQTLAASAVREHVKTQTWSDSAREIVRTLESIL